MLRTRIDRKSTRLNSSHTEIYTLSLHDALPILRHRAGRRCLKTTRSHLRTVMPKMCSPFFKNVTDADRSEEHTSELQSHRDLHSFPTRRSSDLAASGGKTLFKNDQVAFENRDAENVFAFFQECYGRG